MEANILRILVILVGVALVAVVLIQQPKEGGMGAFTGGGGGSGASSTVFGAKGSGNFLFRLTAVLIVTFALMIIGLVKVTNSNASGSILSETVTAEQQDVVPGATDTVGIPGSEINNTTPPVVIENTESIPGNTESVPGAKN